MLNLIEFINFILVILKSVKEWERQIQSGRDRKAKLELERERRRKRKITLST